MKLKRYIPLSLSLRAGLFVLMFLAVLMIGARVYDVALQVAQGKTSVLAPVNAEESKHEDAKPEEKKAEEKKPEEVKAEEAKTAGTDEKKPEEKKEEPAAATAEAVPEVNDPNFEAPELTESEINVLRHLSDRRKALEKRKSELDQRETLLNLTEQRVDKKTADLKRMQEEIRKTLGQADADYLKQVASMVKIYETMKPKDAAKIFGNMDMPTLVDVVSRMKEAKAAPIMAAMEAGKAKELSSALMTKKALPPPP